jgi:trigger factor
MQIEVDELEYCKLSVNYESSTEEIDNKRDEILSIFKKAPVPGFRPGKANMEAIKLYYKSQINESLKRALAEEAFHNTIFEKNIKPLGSPTFTNMLLKDGKFICNFILNVKPKFELSKYKGMEIPKPHSKTINEVAEEMLQQLRIKFGTSSPYEEDEFVIEGDNIIINYTGFVDGEKLDQLSAEGELLTVGSSDLKEFDRNLLGMKLGETRKFSISVPENSIPSLSGKSVDFEVTLVNGSKVSPCPLDDELAKKFNKSTFNELHKSVLEAASVRVNTIVKTQILSQISNKLISEHDFKVPDWLVLCEAKYLAQQSKLSWDSLSDKDKEYYLSRATSNVKLSLILDEIREKESDAQLSDQEVLDMIKDNLSKTNPEISTDDVIKQMSTNGYLQVLFIKIRDEFVLDFIAKHAKIIE